MSHGIDKRNFASHPHEAALAENIGAHQGCHAPINGHLRQKRPELVHSQIEEAASSETTIWRTKSTMEKSPLLGPLGPLHQLPIFAAMTLHLPSDSPLRSKGSPSRRGEATHTRRPPLRRCRHKARVLSRASPRERPGDLAVTFQDVR
jgi:hypothetical protein